MLSKFYEYIAKKIYHHFENASSNNNLLKGETFCLKLDTEDMVSKVTEALKKYVQDKGNDGIFTYDCGNGTIYETFTIKLRNGGELIIAPQINMTSDFLCATLRNYANSNQIPILMISSAPIDSVISGSKNMSANGMPFYGEELIKEFKGMISENTQLTFEEKRILEFELNRRDNDVFSDKESLYEYKDLLAIMSEGKISRENFINFRLFYVDRKSKLIPEKITDVDKKIKENNEWFERIDRCFKFENTSDIDKYFDVNFRDDMQSAYRKDPDNWSLNYSYDDILKQINKHKSKREKPLEINDDNISVYFESPKIYLEYESEWLIRNEGSQKGKKRYKNIVIFNPDNTDNSDGNPQLFIRFNCNDTRIPKSDIQTDNLELIKDGNSYIVKMTPSGVDFKRISIEDKINGIKYIFNICVVNLAAEFMASAIKRCFTINYKKNNKGRIRLSGIENDLIFNENAPVPIQDKLANNKSYVCTFNQKLILDSTGCDLSKDSTKGISINIDFAGLNVPFIIYPDKDKSIPINGRFILKEKFTSRKCFEYIDEKICSDSQEYHGTQNLLRELHIEKQFVDKLIGVGKCKIFYDTKYPEIEIENIPQDQALMKSYVEYLEALKEKNTIPTLAYLRETDELFDKAQKYVNTFIELYSSLKDREQLNQYQENALYLGTITLGSEAEEILLTPLHPINVAYQIALTNESGIGDANDLIVDRLTSLNLLPYIKRKKINYRVSDKVNSLGSLEWKYYAPIENKKYKGNWNFVSKLVNNKIKEFLTNFRYIFKDINNKTIKINLINMGDCSEVFAGIAKFFIDSTNKNHDGDELVKFEIHIYSDKRHENVFSKIKEYGMLSKYLDEQKLRIDDGISMNTLEGLFSKNVECYFHKDEDDNYHYAHLTFYEMESDSTSEQASMSMIETGVSLGGILSGVPSSKYSTKYRTGYGTKYARKTELVKFANLYNSLIQVESSGNPYIEDFCISTQIAEKAESKMKNIYSASNWVVFVNPKVDLDFFIEKENTNELVIIHYSDHSSSSSGYDDITVTQKSGQYSLVIQDYLKANGVDMDNVTTENVNDIINLFNAINGEWLLGLVSSKNDTKENTYSKEKISLVAAIKFMLAHLHQDNIIWVPISLEEMLRVSGGVGLSKKDGILSAKNLEFEDGPTSDDLLFIGVDKTSKDHKIYLYPTEVKTGNNEEGVIDKALKQVISTIKGFNEAFKETDNPDISRKVCRNFLMQMLIISCKKMKAYHVDDSQDWDVILDKFREALLNEDYRISNDIQELMGNGAVLSFKKDASLLKNNFKAFMNDNEDDRVIINFIEAPETDEYELILKSVDEIREDIRQRKDDNLLMLSEFDLSNLTGDTSKIETSEFTETEENNPNQNNADGNENSESRDAEDIVSEEPLGSDTIESDNIEQDVTDSAEKGMKIILGIDEQNGKEVIWKPNDTSQLFHTNTGVIGTMGTGKTQFTKSLITQLYKNQKDNIDEKELGILIFDYKGDYNESKPDFVDATKATIYKPYHLPFNPLALTRSAVFKPLLPIHTANAFKDTISKVYNLGPKQEATLMTCIKDSYTAAGINPGDPSTWDNVAPTFDQVYQRYVNDEEIKKGDSLAAALEKLNMFQIFESNPSETKSLFELLNGVVVIDLSGYDNDIQSLIVAITLDLFYSQMQAAGSSKMDGQYRQLTKIILVDEADNFMSEGFPALKRILKEGREFGVGTILSTQFLKHFGSGEDDYSKYIHTWIVHNVSDLKNSDVDFVFNTEAKSNESITLYNRIKGLMKHHSIIKIGRNKPVYLHDKAFWELYGEIKNE